MAKKAPKQQSTDIESAVSDAYSGMDELKDELQGWYDNLHENFQNGSKGEALQEAINTIEYVSEVTVPPCLCGANVPSVTYYEGKGSSRAARRDTYVAMLDGAVSAAEDFKSSLEEMEFDEDGNRKRELTEGEDVEEDGWPGTESERDTWVDEIDTFVGECEEAKSEYENVEFPGMYG